MRQFSKYNNNQGYESCLYDLFSFAFMDHDILVLEISNISDKPTNVISTSGMHMVVKGMCKP